MEYHYGYKNLKEKLEKSGFKVKKKQSLLLLSIRVLKILTCW